MRGRSTRKKKLQPLTSLGATVNTLNLCSSRSACCCAGRSRLRRRKMKKAFLIVAFLQVGDGSCTVQVAK